MTAEAPIRVLVLEDDLAYARLVEEALTEAPHRFEVHICTSLADALSHLADSAVDAALVDLGLPDAQGLEAIEILHGRLPDLPLVALTGHEPGDGLGQQAIKSGAQDFLSKSSVSSLVLCKVLRYSIERAQVAADVRARTAEELAMLVELRAAIDRFEAGARRRHSAQAEMIQWGPKRPEGDRHAATVRSA